MSSIFELVDLANFDTLFTWDGERRETDELTIDWPEHPIESGAMVSDYGIERPENFELEGVVTATPIGLAMNTQRIQDALAALKALARKRQPLYMVAGYWAQEVVIKTVRAVAGQGDAMMLPITATFKTIQLAKPKTTQIPASRLAAGKRKRMAPAKPGGAKTGTTPGAGTNKGRSWAIGLGSLLG